MTLLSGTKFYVVIDGKKSLNGTPYAAKVYGRIGGIINPQATIYDVLHQVIDYAAANNPEMEHTEGAVVMLGYELEEDTD